MSRNAQYLNFLLNGGEIADLPQPTGVIGKLLYMLCIKFSDLPKPMVFKGTLGTDGTVTVLPDVSEENTGFTYKVITDGSYSGITAKVGDMFVSNGTAWVLIPSGDDGGTEEYSTNEKQIGTWINGKPLYRKVITFAVNAEHLTTAGTGVELISIPNIDAMTSVTGGLYDSGTQLISAGTHYSDNYYFECVVQKTRVLYLNKGYKNGTAYLVVEYTKTTD